MKNVREIKQVLSNENTLFNSKINKLEIESDQEFSFNIRITFNELNKKSAFNKIQLLFSGIKEFSLNYVETYNFTVVENFKFFELNDSSVYISFDPDDTLQELSPNDNNFINCSNVELITFMK